MPNIKDYKVSSYSYKINRYSLDKEYITTGHFMVVDEGLLTQIFYKDEEVEETASDTGLPMIALIALRRKLETKHRSLLALFGCRIDTTLRPTGGGTAYVIGDDNTIDQDEAIDIFEPTTELERLCTVEEHEKAYNQWCNIVSSKENFG